MIVLAIMFVLLAATSSPASPLLMVVTAAMLRCTRSSRNSHYVNSDAENEPLSEACTRFYAHSARIKQGTRIEIASAAPDIFLAGDCASHTAFASLVVVACALVLHRSRAGMVMVREAIKFAARGGLVRCTRRFLLGAAPRAAILPAECV